MTQKQLGAVIGVSRQTMNSIENSKHAPTIDVAIRIADVFGISVDDLFEFTYEGKPKRRPEAPKTTAFREKGATAQTVAIDRPEASVRESIEIASGDEPAKKQPEQEITLASLRNVTGPDASCRSPKRIPSG